MRDRRTRDDLVKTRTQTINRLHVVLTNLIPAGAQRDLTAERAAEHLRGIRPRDPAGKTLRGLATDLISEIRQLDRRIGKAAADIQTAVTAHVDRAVRYRCLDRGQDPRPGRRHRSIPLRGRVHHLRVCCMNR
jgi:hypothetical protein